MASGGAGGYYHGDRYGYGYSYSRQQPAPSATSFHMCLFLATACLLGGASLYSHCESAMESLVDQLRVAVVLSPFVLLLAAQYWSATGRRWRSSYSYSSPSSSSLLAAPAPVVSWEQQPPWYDQRQRDGGASSPWGVALALALVLLLISYQSCFQYWWSPVVRRRR